MKKIQFDIKKFKESLNFFQDKGFNVDAYPMGSMFMIQEYSDFFKGKPILTYTEKRGTCFTPMGLNNFIDKHIDEDKDNIIAFIGLSDVTYEKSYKQGALIGDDGNYVNEETHYPYIDLSEEEQEKYKDKLIDGKYVFSFQLYTLEYEENEE